MALIFKVLSQKMRFFLKKPKKNCNLDCKHSSCIVLTSVQALALYSSGNVLYIMLFELSYFTWRYNLLI